MVKYKNRKANINIYIIPFFIITIIFVIIMFTMSNNVKNYYYDLRKEEALKIARGISIDLSHTGEAVNTINKLLENKLKDSLNAADMNRENYSDELLTELANTFDLDEIYAYNSEGIIEYSNSGKYIGWKAYEDHPVYDFMSGDEKMLIEDIRRDSESELYYKYGYIKHSDGYFIQIGILAEKIHDLLESFRLQNILEEIIVDSSIVQLYALNRDYLITSSTNQESIGLQVKDELIISDLNNGKIYDRVNTSTGVDLYEIYVPLEYETDKIIAFGIWYSLDEMIPVIRKNILIGIAGLITVYISLIYTIFASYKKNKELVQLAYYDNLTSLLNTESLKIHLGGDLITNKNNKAILLIKCYNLNLKNITYGYEFGDKVLKELGSRIKTLEDRNIQLFKFKGDKFVLYIKDYDKKEDLLAIITEIKELLNHPFIVNNNSEHIAIKIGVVEYKVTDKSLDQLLKAATIAQNNVDSTNSKDYSFFNEDMELAIQREEIIAKEIIAAVNEKDDTSKIYLLYQPIMDSRTKKIDGFEALARMNSEQFGFVSPAEFIDIAERTQLIIPLSNLILKMACTFIANLLTDFNDIRVAVNISTIHILQEDFVNTVLNLIKETGINGSNLQLEITESVMIDNFEIVNEKLKELRSVGIQISLDDFGTGYSSFYRLIELNFDILKIDQYFINKINNTNKDSLITRDIISIAHRLGLKTVAEGVESEIQKDYLLEYDCDKFQGYLFSKPVPEEEAVMLLKKHNCFSSSH